MNNYLLDVIIGSFIGHLLADLLDRYLRKHGGGHNESD